MLSTKQKQELKNLSKEILGSDTAYLKALRGVTIRKTDSNGRPLYTETGMAIYHKVTKTAEDVLQELQAIKEKRIAEKLKKAEGKA